MFYGQETQNYYNKCGTLPWKLPDVWGAGVGRVAACEWLWRGARRALKLEASCNIRRGWVQLITRWPVADVWGVCVQCSSVRLGAIFDIYLLFLLDIAHKHVRDSLCLGVPDISVKLKLICLLNTSLIGKRTGQRIQKHTEMPHAGVISKLQTGKNSRG